MAGESSDSVYALSNLRTRYKQEPAGWQHYGIAWHHIHILASHSVIEDVLDNPTPAHLCCVSWRLSYYTGWSGWRRTCLRRALFPFYHTDATRRTCRGTGVTLVMHRLRDMRPLLLQFGRTVCWRPCSQNLGFAAEGHGAVPKKSENSLTHLPPVPQCPLGKPNIKWTRDWI